MAAHQAPPSLGFSRQEHQSGLPFPSPMHGSESEVAQSCPTLSGPMDCSLPGSSVPGIFQARVLEWGAIACYTPPKPLTLIHTVRPHDVEFKASEALDLDSRFCGTHTAVLCYTLVPTV